MCASDSFLLEPGTKAMLDDYAALHNVIDSLDNPDHVELTGEYFRSSFAYPSVEIGRDIIQIKDSEGYLVAAGTIFSQNTSPPSSRVMVQVRPNYQKRGFGSIVLNHLFQTGRKNGTRIFVCRIPSFRPDAKLFAERQGFKHEYSWIKMRLECNKPPRPTVPPQDLILRGLDVGRELETWAHLQNAIYKDSPDYNEITVDSLKAQIKHHSFDPNLLVIGEVSGKPVGLCTGWSITPKKNEHKKNVLQIHGLGVLPEYRRNGYGQSLLLEVLNRAYIDGYGISELVVNSTNQAAISMYMKYGFQERYRHLWYKQEFW